MAKARAGVTRSPDLTPLPFQPQCAYTVTQVEWDHFVGRIDKCCSGPRNYSGLAWTMVGISFSAFLTALGLQIVYDQVQAVPAKGADTSSVHPLLIKVLT